MISFANKSQHVVTGIAIATASLLGLIVPSQGILVLGGLLASVGALVLFIQPILGVFFLAANIPLENLTLLAQGTTFIKFMGMGIFGLWLCGKFAHRESWETLWSNNFFWMAFLLLAFCLASTMWSAYRNYTYLAVYQLVQLFLWSLLIVDLMCSWRRMATLIKILVSTTLIAALLTLEQYFIQDVKRAGDDIAGGVNSTAALLVSVVPFAIYLFRSQESKFWRLLGFLYVLISSVAITVTFSRGSYVAFALLILTYYWKTIWERTGRMWIIFLTGSAIIAAAFVPKDLIYERIQSIVPALQGMLEMASGATTNTSDARGYAWRVAFAMFSDSPIVGVGYGNYGPQYLDYQTHVPGAPHHNYGLRSSHSTYITLLAEGGVLGLAIWLGVLVVIWFRLKTTRSVLASETASERFLLVQALTYSFLLQSFYGWSLMVHQDKFFWMIMGLSVAATVLVKQSGAQPLPRGNDFSSELVSRV
jgi:hypothetical protein